MIVHLAENLKFLRKSKSMTQDAVAIEVGIKRSLLGSYEEGRAVPKPEVLAGLASFYNVSIDSLLTQDLKLKGFSKIDDQKLKVLTTVVTPENNELITIVPYKASAGYLNGYADVEYLSSLPSFSIPVTELSDERTYRVFQIRGDSMLPIAPGAYVFCTYVESVNDVSEGKSFVLLTKTEGVVYKRVYFQNESQFLLKSDNPEYDSYYLAKEDIVEIWRAIGFLSFELPQAGDGALQKLTHKLTGI